jgi:sugar-specific transcriptional regulator TrmB
MSELDEILIFHSFTKLEAGIYLKLLELGQAKVNEIGKITNISRTQLYPLLDSMTEKGYIKQIGTKPITYESLPPKELVKLLREKSRKQSYALAELEEKLLGINPVQKVAGVPYRIYLIKGRVNVVRKLIELWENVETEVIGTSVFERDISSESKSLGAIVKEKVAKGVKNTVYLSIRTENLYKISELKNIYKNFNFGGLIKEQPYITTVFDRKYIIVVFYNFHKREYDNAFYFENPDLAEAFVHKSIAPIESYPLKGEVRLSTIGGERALIIPPVLDTISKEEQYKLGYGVGWYGIKPLRKMNHSLANIITILSMQIIISGWGKAKIIQSGKNETILSVENCVVSPSFLKGDINGFLSVMGNFSVKEKIVDQKERKYEFAIKLK